MTLQNDKFLRVADSSDLGKAINLLLSEDRYFTGAELVDEVGKKNAQWLVRTISRQTDNLLLDWTGSDDDKYHLKYIDVVGRQQTVVNVDSAQFAGGGAEPKAEVEADIEGQLVFPTAPPVLNESDFDYYRKPTWHDTMKAMLKAERHISLAGPPSVGKDTTALVASAEEKMPLVVVNGDGGLRKRDLIGGQVIINGTSKFLVSEFAAAVVNGWWTLVTEINAAEPDALLLLNGIMEDPKVINIFGKQFKVHPNFRLIVSYNPGLVGTKTLPESFKDRFFPFSFGFLTEYELRRRLEAHGMPKVEDLGTMLMNGNPVPRDNWPEVVVKFGMAMWQAHSDGKMRYACTVRRLKDAVTLMNLEVVNDVKTALKSAVLATIDNGLDHKVAEQVLDSVV